MNLKQPLPFVFIALLVSSCGTPSQKTTSFGDFTNALSQAFAPLQELTQLSGVKSFDLLYCSTSFRKMKGRWPNDYDELKRFVQGSSGYLWIAGQYENVSFTPEANGEIELCYTRVGRTNQMKFRITTPSSKD